MIRRASVWLHRYSGLVMAAFLLVTGVTGSILAFNVELERLISPQLFATPRPGVPRLDLASLAERASREVPHGRVRSVTLVDADQVSVNFSPRTDPATGRPYPLGFTEFFIDPWDGHELGRRIRGDLSQGVINLMPFIYELHWTLALGDVGVWVLGVIALIWTLDCLIGLYLTLPLALHGFWRRWKPAWLIKWHAGTTRVNFDLHRSSGLWLWPLLGIFAWSSVMMNLRPAYELVTRSVFDYRSPGEDFASMQGHPNDAPRLDWRAAQRVGARLMDEQAARLGFAVKEPLQLAYVPQLGLYVFGVRSSRDVFERAPKGGNTDVYFDGDSGRLIRIERPTGERAGNTVESWLYALHLSRVFGRFYQVLVCLLGLIVAMMAVTGVTIWLKKRRSRRFSRARRALRLPQGAP